jgi:hypothetical protein
MTMQQAPVGGPDQMPITNQSGGASARVSRPRRRKELAWFLLAMLPLSALLAFVVLQLMAASSAAATGGCGGG